LSFSYSILFDSYKIRDHLEKMSRR